MGRAEDILKKHGVGAQPQGIRKSSLALEALSLLPPLFPGQRRAVKQFEQQLPEETLRKIDRGAVKAGTAVLAPAFSLVDIAEQVGVPLLKGEGVGGVDVLGKDRSIAEFPKVKKGLAMGTDIALETLKGFSLFPGQKKITEQVQGALTEESKAEAGRILLKIGGATAINTAARNISNLVSQQKVDFANKEAKILFDNIRNKAIATGVSEREAEVIARVALDKALKGTPLTPELRSQIRKEALKETLGLKPEAGFAKIPSKEDIINQILKLSPEIKKADLLAAPIIELQTQLSALQETAIPPELNPVEKLTKVLKQAKPIRGKQETLFRKERAKRFAKAEATGKEVGGQAGFLKELGALKGELPKAQFEPIVSQFKQEDIDSLFNSIKDASQITYLEGITARSALTKLFGGQGVKLPTKGELALLKKIFPEELINTLTDKTPFAQKAKDVLSQLINIPRSVLSSFDASFGGRQGAFALPKFTKEFGKAWIKQFQAMRTDEAFKNVMTQIEQDPDFPLAVDSGIAFTDVGTDPTLREEKFMSNWAERIPGVGGRGIPVKVGKFNFTTPSLSVPFLNIAASARAYTGMANSLRMSIFKSMVKDLGVLTGEEVNFDLAKQIANQVNAMTGRGELLPALQNIATLLNGIFFSPRLAASRLTLLNPVRYVNQSPEVRKESLKTLFAFTGLVMTILTFAKLSGAEVETDPNSSDFGKIRIGNTRIDLLAGFGQYIVLGARLFSGSIKSATTGKVTKLGEGFKPLTRLDILARFIEFKQSPVASFVTTLLKGRGPFGEEVTLGKEVRRRFIPMVIQDMIEISQEEPKLFPISLLGIFGIGIQTFKGRTKPGAEGRVEEILRKHKVSKETTTNDRINQILKKHGLE